MFRSNYGHNSNRQTAKSNPLFENYAHPSRNNRSAIRSSALSTISNYRASESTHRPATTSSFNLLQPDSRFALTLTDVRRDESQYGSSTRAQSARRAKVVKRSGDWENLAVESNRKDDPTRQENSSNNRKVWQWRGRTIAFGGKNSNAFHSGSIVKPQTCPALNVPKGRWGGSVGKSPRSNESKNTKNVNSLQNNPEMSKAKISKTEKEPKRRLENHSQKNRVAVEKPKSEVVKKQQPKKTEPADQKDIAKLQSPEKMVFVIPDSSKNVKTMKESQQKPDIIAKGSVRKSENSIPAKTQASKSVLSNTIATSTPSKSGFQTKKKKKKKKRIGRVSFTMKSPDVKIFQPVDQKDKDKLWHSHEDSIRNRIQLRQEKFEEKLAVKKKVDEENRKLDEAKKEKQKDEKEAKKRAREQKLERKKRRERIKKEKERLLLKRKMEQQEKKELRRHQRQAKKAQKKIENNLLKKFGLHVSEVEDDDEDDAIHDKICELEAELQILKGKAIENAKAKNQLKMAGRSGRVVGKGGAWRNGRDKNVIDFHNSIQLPNDMISTLTLKQRQEMKKYKYSFE